MPSLPLLAAFLVFAFSLAFCVGLAKLLLLFQLLRQHRNFRLVYKFILLVHKKKKKKSSLMLFGTINQIPGKRFIINVGLSKGALEYLVFNWQRKY